MTTATTTKLTYADYVRIPEDGRRHEIIDGEHYVSPGANSKHQIVSFNFVLALGAFVKQHRLGRVFHPRYDVLLSAIDIVEPDVLFVSNARLHMVAEKNFQGAPDLVVEVLSESNRRNDEILKKKRYEHFGVNEYWIADPELETVEIYRRAGDAFAPAEIIGTEDGGTITTPLLPGFELPIADVFAD